MHLENLVFDAADPRRVGLFWEELVDGERLTDEPEGFETRLALGDDGFLDLCFQRVEDPSAGGSRLTLAVRGEHVGSADPEGNPMAVTEGGEPGPLAAILLDSADPDRDTAFWVWLTGWEQVGETTLRHPSGAGPLLELRPESEPKGSAKNRVHLDVRLDAGEDADAAGAAITERGGAPFTPDWGDLPWRSYTDPSGNEFCVLPAPAEQAHPGGVE